MASMNLGQVRFVYKGEYDAETAYGVHDWVSYNGSSFVALRALDAGTTPVIGDTTYWATLAEKGETGTDGADGVNGADGADGQDGATGATGAQGEQGIQGPAVSITSDIFDDDTIAISTGGVYNWKQEVDSDLSSLETSITEKTQASSSTVQGIISLASTAQVLTGEEASKAVTPATLQAKGTDTIRSLDEIDADENPTDDDVASKTYFASEKAVASAVAQAIENIDEDINALDVKIDNYIVVIDNTIPRRELISSSDNSITILKGTQYKFGEYSYTAENDTVIVPTIDTGTKENGKDYSLYITHNGTAIGFVYSLSQINPTGFDSTNSLRIGGFHTLCADTGDLEINAGMEEEHPLANKGAGIILPASIWDRNHRPRGICLPDGMVYSQKSDSWSTIYWMSGNGYDTKSEYGAIHSVNRNYSQFMNDLRLVGMEFLSDEEFVDFSIGSNQQTNIVGSADKSTVGGYSDTAGRRMVSIYGNEEMCGYLWTLLKSWSAHGYNTESWITTNTGMGFTVWTGMLLAGGNWSYGVYSGSFCRNGSHVRSYVLSDIGMRGRCASHILRLNG